MGEQVYFTFTIVCITLFGGIVLAFKLEREKRAFQRSFAIFSTLLLVAIVHHLWSLSFFWYALVLLVAALLIFMTWLIPFSFPKTVLKIDQQRVDERTTIFSRMFELSGIDKKSQEFYTEFPKYAKIDKRLRSLPGLLSRESLFYDPYYAGIAEKYDQKLQKLVPEITGRVNKVNQPFSQKDTVNRVKQIARELGAISLGFTRLQDYHFYSKKGRGHRYNDAIVNKHGFAIAITVEMEKDAVDQAPKAPVIAESVKQYYRSAKIAVAVAKYLRESGHEATAHIDVNYEVICPLVARDAGLGDIGRMGILMTPELGPRVRIAVVTTTLELPVSQTRRDYSLQYFCNICKKCAKACPSQAIQKGELIANGQVRYRINHEKCYGYWAKAGTDCARCMRVCPYSHPNNCFHNIIRSGIKRSPCFARLALFADDFFYGRIPEIK